MADDEKLIANALQTVFKAGKIPAELYEKHTHELTVGESEVVKVNMTLKRGLVIDIEDDSHFKSFLNTNDIVLSVNDKPAAKENFKLHDLFKEKGTKTFTFAYLRMRWALDERPPIEDADRREGYDYKVLVLFHYQRVPLGLIIQSFKGEKVMVMDVQAKSMGSMCFIAGDFILQINGVRQANDAAKTLESLANEIEQHGYARITVERPCTDVTKAKAAFTIQSDHRDPPVPADCAAYIKDALKRLKDHEPKSILKEGKSSGSDESTTHVAFHACLSSENIIPSDIADELLVKTPNRVPGVSAPPVEPEKPPPSNMAVAVMGKPASMMRPPVMIPAPPSPVPTPPPSSPKPKGKGAASRKSTAEKNKGRKGKSAEVITRVSVKKADSKSKSTTKTKRAKKKDADRTHDRTQTEES